MRFILFTLVGFLLVTPSAQQVGAEGLEYTLGY
jgi:hypothetical protein